MEQSQITIEMLQQELPGLTGFSETNIKNMRIFYETWSPILNRQLTSADLDTCNLEWPLIEHQRNFPNSIGMHCLIWMI